MAVSGDDYLIVAAIDFGTAFSGYAYSFRHHFESDPMQMAVNIWSPGSFLSGKTSTCALFDTDKKFHSFGFEAEDKYCDLALDGKSHRDWYFFELFKMDLYNKKSVNRTFEVEDTLGRPLPALDVFSESIGYLKDHLLKNCRQRLPQTEKMDIKWVLTVPTIWNYAAKQFMRDAALKAGIADDRLSIGLEPEVASLWCKYLPLQKFPVTGKGYKVKPFKTGSKYLVLDAGGGTVDITVHKVKQNGSLSEVFKASCGNWGGTYVNKAFKNFLSAIIGNDVMGTFIKEQMYDYFELFRSFEIKKRTFRGQVTEKLVFRVPVSMNKICKEKRKKDIKDILPSTRYSDKIAVVRDKLLVSPDIVNEFFDEPCQEIVAHLEKIFSKPEVKDVDFILMVGGFSESLILQDYIKTAFPNKTVVVPNGAGLAVLKGAVIFGQNNKLISERIARFTYGIETSIPFNADEHPRDKMIHDDDNNSLCKNIFGVHVKIGDTVKTGTMRARSYFVVRKRQDKMRIRLFATTEKKPVFVTDPGCSLIGTLTIDMHGYGMDRSAEVQMMFGGPELKVHAVESLTGEKTTAKLNFSDSG